MVGWCQAEVGAGLLHQLLISLGSSPNSSAGLRGNRQPDGVSSCCNTRVQLLNGSDGDSAASELLGVSSELCFSCVSPCGFSSSRLSKSLRDTEERPQQRGDPPVSAERLHNPNTLASSSQQIVLIGREDLLFHYCFQGGVYSLRGLRGRGLIAASSRPHRLRTRALMRLETGDT